MTLVETSPTSGAWRWLKRFLLALVSLEAAAFGLLVVSHAAFGRPHDLRSLLRRYGSDPEASRALDYDPRNGHAVPMRNVAECGYTTDRYGFIHNGDPSRDFRRAGFRIFVVGGSTVAGFGASCNPFTLPALLERRIRDAGYPDVAVVNAGVPGYYSPQELTFVVDEVLRYDPHVVVSLTGINDAYVSVSGYVSEDPSSPRHRAAYYMSPYVRDLGEQRKAMESPLGALAQAIRNVGAIARRSYLAYVLGVLEHALRRPELRAPRAKSDPFVGGVVAAYGAYVPKQTLEALLGPADASLLVAEAQPSLRNDRPPAGRTDQLDRLARAYVRYLSAERAALEAQGVRFLCVFQPQLALEHDRLTESEAIGYRITEIAMKTRFDVDFARDVRWFMRSADEQLHRHGVVCSDATGVFAQETGTYFDPTHANDKGNGLLAGFLFDELVKQGLLPARASDPR